MDNPRYGGVTNLEHGRVVGNTATLSSDTEQGKVVENTATVPNGTGYGGIMGNTVVPPTTMGSMEERSERLEIVILIIINNHTGDKPLENFRNY